ncbi:MAG: type II toxin-antitoxin system VapC family toxin [Gallionellaceae bacterium]|nr:type II toxin-antitoxin system VapC family toxin [Gallionellaceae bacterium]
MRPLALDTNAYTAFKRGDAEVLAVLRQADRLLISVTVLGELLAGFAAGNREAENREELSRFLASPRVEQAPTTTATADLYALVYAALRRRGTPIPTNDLWIAASALEHGVALMSFDAHFGQIDSLRVGTRLADFLP